MICCKNKYCLVIELLKKKTWANDISVIIDNKIKMKLKKLMKYYQKHVVQQEQIQAFEEFFLPYFFMYLIRVQSEKPIYFKRITKTISHFSEVRRLHINTFKTT